MSLNEYDKNIHPQNQSDQQFPALEARNLSKHFDAKPAVQNLSLKVPCGSFYGLVGPNGAGKTTTILMCTGLLEPSGGETFIAGHSVWGGGALEAKANYGLLVDGMPVFDRLTGKEYLSYLGQLREIDNETITHRSEQLLGALGLQESADKIIADYSAGMTKKILLAGALLHRPTVLILDEPFEAVDPVSAKSIRTLLQRFTENGGTVIISSHVMELVESICDHVAVIAQGTVLASGSLEEVRQGQSLGDRFISLVGDSTVRGEDLEWL